MLKNLALLLFSVVFLSCVSTFQIDGKPIPEHTYTQKNPRTNIRVDFLFVRYIEKKEGKETFDWPDYLEVNEDVTIPEDTKSLYLTLQVVNTMKVKYKLKQFYKIWENETDLYPYNVYQVISESKFSNRVHNIKLPYRKGIKVEYDLYLFDKNNDLIMKMGQIRYKIK